MGDATVCAVPPFHRHPAFSRAEVVLGRFTAPDASQTTGERTWSESQRPGAPRRVASQSWTVVASASS